MNSRRNFGERAIALLEAVLDSTAHGIMVVGLDGKILALNERFIRLCIPRTILESAEDQPLLDFVAGQLSDPDVFLNRVKAPHGVPENESLYFKDGRVFEHYSQALTVGGSLTGTVWSFRDISRQTQAEESRARLDTERAYGRGDLLSELSKALSSTLYPQLIHKRLARFLARRLAEWAVVAIRDPNGTLQVTGKCSLDPNAPEGIPRAMRTGEPVLYSRLDSSALSHFGLLGGSCLNRFAGEGTGIVAPLACRGRVQGAFLLIASSRRPPYREADLALAQEVADRAALAIDNASLYQQAQAAIRIREEFISIASHELRTPLTPLVTQLNMIHKMLEAGGKDFLSSEQLHKLVRLSEHDLERLSRLVNNLLDISRIGASRFALEPEEMDLSADLETIASRFRACPGFTGCRIDLKVEPGIRGSWDRSRLQQVVENLMSNALKYGGGKPIQVSLRTRGDRVVLEVRDHGVGVDEADRERIFGRFERTAKARQFGGLGLGLYISRQIVEAHGGSIRAEPAEGGGSRFIVELPRAESLPIAA